MITAQCNRISFIFGLFFFFLLLKLFRLPFEVRCLIVSIRYEKSREYYHVQQRFLNQLLELRNLTCKFYLDDAQPFLHFFQTIFDYYLQLILLSQWCALQNYRHDLNYVGYISNIRMQNVHLRHHTKNIPRPRKNEIVSVPD